MRCPACGETRADSSKKPAYLFLFLWLGGLFGILIAAHFYPPLDENPLMILSLCFFFSPVAIILVFAMSRGLGLSLNIDRLRRVFLYSFFYSGSALMLMTAFLALNGMADRAPARLVRTSIIRKYITHTKAITDYHCVVSSWRPGRSKEEVRVNEETYYHFLVGEPIVVEVHAGLFGLPWYGRISPQ